MRMILNSCLIALGSKLASAASEPAEPCCMGDAELGPFLGPFGDGLHHKDVFQSPRMQGILARNLKAKNATLDVSVHTEEGWMLYRPTKDEPSIVDIRKSIIEKTRKRIERYGQQRILNSQVMVRANRKNCIYEHNGKKFKLVEQRFPWFEELTQYTFNPENPRHKLLSDVVVLKKIKKNGITKDVPVLINLTDLKKCVQFRTHIAGFAGLVKWWMVENCNHGGCKGHNWPVVGITENLFTDSKPLVPQFEKEFKGSFEKSRFSENGYYTGYDYRSGLLTAQEGTKHMDALDIALESERFKQIAELEEGRERRRRRRLLESLYR